MKRDVEATLRNNPAIPRRELRPTFTKDVLEKIRLSSVQQTIEQGVPMKHTYQPALIAAAAVAVVALSGTAYAYKDAIFATLTGSVKDASGNNIVTVDYKDCKPEYFGWNPDILIPDSGKLYFRIKPGSKITEKEVVENVEGSCQLHHDLEAESGLLAKQIKHYEAKGTIVGGWLNERVTKVTPTSLSTTSTEPVVGSTATYSLTYTHIASDVLVMKNGKSVAWSDIQPGDSIATTRLATGSAAQNTETTRMGSINPDEVTIIALMINNPSVAKFAENILKPNSDVEPVIPCKNGPNGYCNLQEYSDTNAAAPASTPSQTTTPAPTTNNPQVTGQETSKNNREAVLAMLQKNVNSLVAHAQNQNLAIWVPPMTKEFAKKYATPASYDPLTCAQTIPSNIVIKSARATSNGITYTVDPYGYGSIYADITVQSDGTISDVVCHE